MELVLWTYEGPPHVGSMRIASSMRDVHYVIHAPQGDTYADLLFTMIERQGQRPPVSYTTFQARDLGADTAGLLRQCIVDTVEHFQPAALMVGESCTAELIQDQPGSLAEGMGLPMPIIPLELPAYSKKENWGAAESFYALVRHLLATAPPCAPDPETDPVENSAPRTSPESRSVSDQEPEASTSSPTTSLAPRANLLGPTRLGFRCRDDVIEIRRLLEAMGVIVNVVAPLGASVADIRRIPDADFNICLYPEIARTVCHWLKRQFGQPVVETVPIGITATERFLQEVAALTGLDASSVIRSESSRLPWYSRSVDSTYLSGKRVFIFADATHAIAAARIARDELGFAVVGLGSYSREMTRDMRQAAEAYGLEALITDDYLEVEQQIEILQPELVLGTQMERHIAKRLGIACAVISSPFHVQDVPARYSPQMGHEGANVIFDTWVHPLTMGLEEHLLAMFREDFEFHDDAPASHLQGEIGHGGALKASTSATSPTTGDRQTTEAQDTVSETVTSDADTADTQGSRIDASGSGAPATPTWSHEAEQELKKIPFFVRGKARRNTETYASDLGATLITLDTLYEAKAHYAR